MRWPQSSSFFRFIVLSAVAALLLELPRTLPASAAVVPDAGDWSTYLHDPGRTAASTDLTITPANAGQLTNAWSLPTGGVIAASATVVDGSVYVGSWDGYEYALDAATGSVKWQTFLGITAGGPDCVPPMAGVSSAAAVDNGVVYVGGGDAFWYALDAMTGSVLWRVVTGGKSATGGPYNWRTPRRSH